MGSSLGFQCAFRWVLTMLFAGFSIAPRWVFTKVPFTGFHRFAAVFFRWVSLMGFAGFLQWIPLGSPPGFWRHVQACGFAGKYQEVALRWKIPWESRFSVWLMDRDPKALNRKSFKEPQDFWVVIDGMVFDVGPFLRDEDRS